MHVQKERIEGHWRLTRRIRHQDGAIWRFTGEARIANGLWFETGQLCCGTGPALAAERRYRYRAQNHGLAIFFDDGRAFHQIGPGPRSQDQHWCDPDQYKVSYRFGTLGWASRWQVSGPQKSYGMVSLYQPLDDDP